MDPSDSILLLVLLILIYLSAFFSSSETALTTVNRHRLRSLAENGNTRAALVLKTLDNQGKMLSAILIGNNIVNLTASSLTTVLASKIGGWVVGVATGVLTLVILIFGEISPKTIATLRAEKLALRNVKIIRAIMWFLTPVIFCINRLSRLYLWILRIDPNERPDSMTEDELRTIVEVSHEEGVIESDEKQMINNVFDLGDSQAKDVMVPRVSVVCADIDSTYEEMLEIFKEERFTRIPIFEETPDNIVGILNMKDLVLYKQGTPFHISDFLREAFFTHEFKNTYELFHEMRQASMTMSIVLDEYGSMVGLITMEDILEEIVGEIRDEFDEQELDQLQKINDREYLVEGSYKLDDLNDEIGTDLESEDYDSIGGYLLGLLDHFPEVGEQATDEEGYCLITEAVDRNRIEKVRLILPQNETGSEEQYK